MTREEKQCRQVLKAHDHNALKAYSNNPGMPVQGLQRFIPSQQMTSVYVFSLMVLQYFTVWLDGV